MRPACRNVRINDVLDWNCEKSSTCPVRSALRQAGRGVITGPSGIYAGEIVTTRNWGQFRLSPDGRWAVFTGVGRYFGHPLFPRFGNDNNLRIVSTKTGEMLQVTSGSFAKTYPRFSPDGRRIAYESEGDIWTVELSGGRQGGSRRTSRPTGMPPWSPNASEIAFVSRRWRSSDL